MKKLMFAAAMVASMVAIAADVSELDVDDGVYNIAITQKTLVPTYGTEVVTLDEGEEIVGTGKTKAEAQENAESMLEEGCKVKKGVSKKIDGEYTYTIYSYTQPTEEITSSKVASANVAGLLVKGDDSVPGCEDGTLFIWLKAKDQVKVIDYKKGYEAFPFNEDMAILKGKAVAKKSVGVICLTDDPNEITMQGAGFGTASADFVKTVSGQMVTSADDYENDVVAYGTWKIQLDANLTKLGKKGYTIKQLLQKKGAVETKDIE